jgi:hypothetical protein
VSGPGCNRKAFTFAAATLACIAAVTASIALAYPESVEVPALGAEWQCHRAAIVTTCTHVHPRAPTDGSRDPAKIPGSRVSDLSAPIPTSAPRSSMLASRTFQHEAEIGQADHLRDQESLGEPREHAPENVLGAY